MRTDVFGNEHSLMSAYATEEWDKLQLAFLAHSADTPTHLGAVLGEEPNFAMGHAVKGLFYLMLGRRELVQTAQEAYAEAERAARVAGVTKRERKYVEALGLWLAKKPREARDCFELVLKDTPGDALAMKLSHAASFILGDTKTLRGSIENVLPAYDEKNAAFGYLQGCYAFSLEETGDYERAKAAGVLGMQFAPNDAWGLHAVAHVYDMTANAEDGLKWLSGKEQAWSHCNNFRYHVWWHKALMHLDLGQIDQVLALYDSEIRKDKTDDYRDISNATSLLSRLELEGVNVGDRWEELADISEKRTADGCLIFADLHYLLALIGGDRDEAIASMMARLNTDAKDQSNEICRAMADPGLATACGLEAFGEAKFETAFINLAQARRNLQLAGGSHAQRDVFERLTIDAGIRGGFFEEAKIMLKERQTLRGGTEDGYTSARLEMITSGLKVKSVGVQAAAE